jgi:hypothetical protein
LTLNTTSATPGPRSTGGEAIATVLAVVSFMTGFL